MKYEVGEEYLVINKDKDTYKFQFIVVTNDGTNMSVLYSTNQEKNLKWEGSIEDWNSVEPESWITRKKTKLEKALL